MVSPLAQAKFDVGNWLRNGEQALLNVLFPLAALAGSTQLNLTATERAALIVLFSLGASSFTSVAIATAFDRRAGALKVYGISPLGRRGFVQARVLASLAISALQIFVVTGLALIAKIDFAPTLILLAAAGLSTVAWISIALILASLLRAEAVLAVANLLFIASTALTWMVHTDPSSLSFATPMSCAFAASQGSASALIGLSVWSITSLAAAIKTFRWE